MKRVLLIGNEKSTACHLKKVLEGAGYRVSLRQNVLDGVRQFSKDGHDIVLLSIPVLYAVDACLQLRTGNILLPILAITEELDEMNCARLLEAGADDYVHESASMLTVTAKVRAMIRRVETYNLVDPGAESTYRFPGLSLEIDVSCRQVVVGGRDVRLTAKEFDLLLQLARHPGQVFSRAQLLDSVWGYRHEIYEHTVNSHINRLRTKIEQNPGNPEIVCTVWGVGYRFGVKAN